MDWGTIGVIAALLALQSSAFGFVLHRLHEDLVGLRGEVATLRGDLHRLETSSSSA
jgi:hypothetical protein